MKRNGHPLRKKVSQGEFRLISPLDIPGMESKLNELSLEERIFVAELLESYRVKNEALPNS
jgi:hypothetical protein